MRLALALSLLLATCSTGPRAPFGDPCTSDEACESGSCVGDGTGRPEGRCTRTCARPEDCPSGWSCGAITDRGVAVCIEGNGIPLFPSTGR